MQCGTRSIVIILLLLGIVGCRYPDSQVRTTDDRPRIALENAPRDSLLYVDKIKIGPAKNYTIKKGPLRLEPGTHHVVVRAESGTELLKETIFLGGGELKVLKIIKR